MGKPGCQSGGFKQLRILDAIVASFVFTFRRGAATLHPYIHISAAVCMPDRSRNRLILYFVAFIQYHLQLTWRHHQSQHIILSADAVTPNYYRYWFDSLTTAPFWRFFIIEKQTASLKSLEKGCLLIIWQVTGLVCLNAGCLFFERLDPSRWFGLVAPTTTSCAIGLLYCLFSHNSQYLKSLFHHLPSSSFFH